MFGAKYSRLKFWIISFILLLMMTPVLIAEDVFKNSGNANIIFIIAVSGILISAIWMNTLANRIRDYGDNPWIALFSIIPLANIGLALFYGIAKSNIKEVVKKSDNNSLTSAVYNHSKDVVNEIKPTIDEYKENHSTSKLDNDIKSFTIDEINNHPDRAQINDFDNSYFTKLKETKFNYLTEDEIYEKIMIEIETDNKVKSNWARALAQSDGNRDKAEAIYIKERVLFFKNQQEIEQKQKEEEIKRKKEIEQKQKEEEIKRKKEIEQKQNNSLSDEKLKIIGIGSGGSNIVEFIQSMNNGEFNCLIIDTNQIDLNTKQVSFKILLTEALMNGLNQIEQFKINSLDIFIGNVKSVTIIVTLGGTVGSISSLSIIRYLISKQINVNVITTKPFTWEGEERSLLANNFLTEVNKYSIYLKVFNNDDILDYENLSMKEQFSLLDNNILQEIKKLKQVK